MTAYIIWNPKKDIFSFFDFHIAWYSIFFLLGFLTGYIIFLNLLKRYFLEKENFDIKKRSVFIADKLTQYVVIATIIGARLGHIFLYESPKLYLKNPIVILKVWEGGLASHGGAIAIMFAIYLLSKKIRKVTNISFLKLLDFIAVPTALAGAFIRIGNFFNQEVLGKITDHPFGIIFLSPLDNSSIAPRHPVMLYESFSYLLTFFILFYLSYKKFFLLKEGKLIGLFFIFIFSSRFILEFFKLNQSFLINDFSYLLMGQILSIPFILIGFMLLYIDKIKSFFLKTKRN